MEAHEEAIEQLGEMLKHLHDMTAKLTALTNEVMSLRMNLVLEEQEQDFTREG